MSIEIEINGQPYPANQGETVIEVTDKVGIAVPRFCYHKHLSVAANCRMCLVDIEGMPKPQPACSTPVSGGMKIHTTSERAQNAQKSVMELLLINHPLDCPICDQGGECELQDVAIQYGSGVSHFAEGKRIVSNKNLGTLIQTDMTRCIHCSRCVRFGTEVAGMTEMGMLGRGEHVSVEPFIASTIDSELSGNMIDVCPVGALTSKPFRYQIRSWQLRGKQAIGRHDSVGSNLCVQCYKGDVKRITAAENDAINQTWISDRDRFSYQGLSHPKRLVAPKIKVEGEWQEVDWQSALDFTHQGLSNVINTKTAQQIGGLASANATLEEMYLFAQWIKKLGSNNIDHRLAAADLTDKIVPHATIDLPTLAKQQYVLVVGGHPRLEQPMLNHRLRQSVLAGGEVMFINAASFDINYPAKEYIASADEMLLCLAAVAEVLSTDEPTNHANNAMDVSTDEAKRIVNALQRHGSQSTLILGSHLSSHSQASTIYQLAQMICQHSGANLVVLNEQANAAGALLADVLPGDGGLNAQQMLTYGLAGYALLDVYPSYDCLDANTAVTTLTNADFVCAFNSFQDSIIDECADVVLPISSFYETAGTHVNLTGALQSFEACVPPAGQSKPAWKVIKVLADLFALEGFDYCNENDILQRVKDLPKSSINVQGKVSAAVEKHNEVNVIWQLSPYAKDALCRHAQALQDTAIGQLNSARMNSQTAAVLALKNADNYQNVPITIDESVADNTVFVCSYQPKISTQVGAKGMIDG